jgi:hypothetical protein
MELAPGPGSLGARASGVDAGPAHPAGSNFLARTRGRYCNAVDFAVHVPRPQADQRHHQTKVSEHGVLYRGPPPIRSTALNTIECDDPINTGRLG